MVRITYVSHDGTRHDVDAAVGSTLMQTALERAVPNIVGECGGSAMCATCHVYVDPAHLDRLPPVDAVEDEMLNSTADERRPNSRLSCQLTVTPAFEGLVVHVPKLQT